MVASKGCKQGLVGAWASMTPLNAARPSAGVDVTSRGTWGEEPTGVSGKKRDEREDDRPESESLAFLITIAEPSAGRSVSKAMSASSGKISLL